MSTARITTTHRGPTQCFVVDGVYAYIRNDCSGIIGKGPGMASDGADVSYDDLIGRGGRRVAGVRGLFPVLHDGIQHYVYILRTAYAYTRH